MTFIAIQLPYHLRNEDFFELYEDRGEVSRVAGDSQDKETCLDVNWLFIYYLLWHLCIARRLFESDSKRIMDIL